MSATSSLPDLTGRSSIELLVNTFYDRIRADALLGPIFGGIAQVNWETHLPRMYAFWESVLFRAGTYRGNPIAAHARLVPSAGMTREHFDHWLALFQNTVQSLFAGENAGHIQRAAGDMANVIYSRIHQVPDPRFDPSHLSPEQRARYAAYNENAASSPSS
jgi:hemoglobin